MDCPQCHAPAADPAANFCEECGAKLSPLRADPAPGPAGGPVQEGGPCVNCGADPDAVDSEGFCSRCGHQRRPPSRDHFEAVAGPGLAGVSDRGARHFRNEDALALGQADGYTAAVVCDGVSNSPRSDEASAAATAAIHDALLAGAPASAANLNRLMEEAFARAQIAVSALASPHGKLASPAEDLPAATAVAALMRPLPSGEGTTNHEVILAWLGDSRAYFFDRKGGARLLTKDHSLVNELMDAGQITRAQSLHSRDAHTVTKTLGGAPSEGDRPDVPSIVRVLLPEPGWLILCTDGVWNYAPEAPELAAWLQRLVPREADALALCRAFVGEALRLGGRDNVTVVAVAV